MNSQRKRHKFSVASFVLGVVSVVIPFVAVFTPCPIIALVLGSIAIHKANTNPETVSGKGLAIAGVACASVAIVEIFLIYMVFGISLLLSI